MAQGERTVKDVVGDDPALLGYWQQISPQVQQRLLDSTINVCTLGELKKLAEELETE